MSMRERLLSEAFAGVLTRNKKRFSLINELTFDEFIIVNEQATKELFDRFAEDKNLHPDEIKPEIMIAGLRAFYNMLPREASLTTIFHDIDNKVSRPGWAYNVRKRRFRR